MKPGIQDEIDRDHAHEAGEKPQDHSHVHVGLAILKTKLREAVGDTEHKEGGQNAGKHCDDQCVCKHSREIQDRCVCKELFVVGQCVSFGKKCRHIGAFFRAEAGENDPEDGEDPDCSQNRQDDMHDHIIAGPLCFCVFHRQKPPSSL